jgi:phenylalanyl-tRNA synthetase alpha chain
MAASHYGQQGDLPTEILQLLAKNDPILSSEALPSEKSADVKAALDRLASRSMIKYETIEREVAILEDEGVEIEANGSHEARVFEALREAVEGLTVKELEAAIGDKKAASLGQGKAFKSKWIAKGKDGRLVASVSYYSTIKRFTSC